MITTRRWSITRRDERWAAGRVRSALASRGFDGYVLKKDSPSCGWNGEGIWNRRRGESGRASLADALLASCRCPRGGEGVSADPRLRENFVGVCSRIAGSRISSEDCWSQGALVRFHTVHKMSLLAHSTTAYQEMGRLVAAGARVPRRQLRTQYYSLFMSTLALPARPPAHERPDAHGRPPEDQARTASKQELLASIEEYRKGFVPCRFR